MASNTGVFTRLENCKVCGSDKTAFYSQKNEYRIIKCLDCGCGFLELGNTCFNATVFYQGYYNSVKSGENGIGYNNYLALEKALKLTFRKRIGLINKFLKNNLKRRLLLDIGCGPGFFLEVAAADFDTYGVEISQEAAVYARDNLGLKVINSRFSQNLFAPDTFDIITLWDTIEHIDDPHLLLKGISGILKRDGLLAFTTGDFGSFSAKLFGNKWHLFNIPEHLFFFTKKGITHLLNRQGFEIIYSGYPFSYYTLDYILERLIKSFDIPLKKFYLAHQDALKNIIIPLNPYDIMLVICRRNK